MSNITIGRYEPDSFKAWSGWIEGTDDAGRSWITFLDRTGRPTLYWPEREESGAVAGPPILLSQ